MRIRILVATVVLAVLAGRHGVRWRRRWRPTAGPAVPATGRDHRPHHVRRPATPARQRAVVDRHRRARPDRCHTSELSASLPAGNPGAGPRYATLSLTNTSARTCTVFGYGGLQPLDADKEAAADHADPGHRAAGSCSGWRRRQASAGPPLDRGPVRLAALPHPGVRVDHPAGRDHSPLVIGWSLGPICGDATMRRLAVRGDAVTR